MSWFKAWFNDMIYLVQGYDLPGLRIWSTWWKDMIYLFLWKGFFLQKEAFLTNFPLGWFQDMIYLPFLWFKDMIYLCQKTAENIFCQRYGLRIWSTSFLWFRDMTYLLFYFLWFILFFSSFSFFYDYLVFLLLLLLLLFFVVFFISSFSSSLFSHPSFLCFFDLETKEGK